MEIIFNSIPWRCYKLIILGMLGIGLEAYNKFFIANASLSIVVIESDRAFLRTLNDTCHIKNLITAKS